MNHLGHPMTRLSNPHSQQLGFLSDLKEWGQNIVTEYIDEPLRAVGQSVGLTDAEINRIAAETNKAYQQELQQAQQELIKTAVGMDTKTQQAGMIQDLQRQLQDARNMLAQNVPGGMNTVYALGGIAALGGIYYFVLRNPK